MIRVATEKDLDSIVEVHKICFPESFTTAMGHHLLTRYYMGFMSRNPELFLVSENAEKNLINGFCMGYYDEDFNYIRTFIQRNFIRFAFRMFYLLVCGNRLAWKRVSRVFGRNSEVITIDDSASSFTSKESGELLSICVLPCERGNGVSSELLEEYLTTLSQNGRKCCVLSVLSNNDRAIRFYEKKGFRAIKKIGDTSVVYAKNI